MDSKVHQSFSKPPGNNSSDSGTPAPCSQLSSDIRFRRLVEQSIVGIYVIQEDCFVYANPKLAQILGVPQEQLLGRSMFDFIYKEDHDLARKNVQRRLSNQADSIHYELRMVRADGKVIHIEAHGGRIEREGKPAIQGTLLDITEKKNMEAQLLRAQRMECIGRLSSGIAHDLNNILTPIMMSVFMLRQSALAPGMEETIEAIESSAQRGSDLIKQLLMFGRGTGGIRTKLNFRSLVKDVVKMVHSTLPKGISMVAETTRETEPVVGDPTQIHQVILNLCVNARDAMPAGGTICIAAKNVTVKAPRQLCDQQLPPGGYVLLSVSDTGTGIPAEILGKIFEPFFTTKPAGRGTGLGLSTVMDIVKLHGGALNLETQVGRGTMVAIYFPVASDAVESDGARAPSPPRGRGEVIMIVDDEPEIRQIVQNVLLGHGYNTVTATDGSDAIAIYVAGQAKIKAVVTDTAMPLMDGVTMSRTLKKINPALPIIAASGVGCAEDLEERAAALREAGVEMFLTKPYSADKILNALAEVLPQGS